MNRLTQMWPTLSESARAAWITRSQATWWSSDLLLEFQRRRNAIAAHLRYVREAKENAAAWPSLRGPKAHVEFCLHGLATAMHLYCGREKPVPLPPPNYAESQSIYFETVMAIPVGACAR